MSNRKLSAILFTDISGYTALMQQDEAKALTLLKDNRTLHQGITKTFRGRIIKELGDGMLCLFSTVTDAVDAAMALQKACQSFPGLRLGMGLHSGEILEEHEDVFGDSVNLASRIQSLGVPGAVLISESVYQAIRNKPQYKCKPLGHFHFKNVEHSMPIYCLANEGLKIPDHKEMGGKLKPNPPGRSLVYFAFLLILVLGWFGVNQFRKAGLEEIRTEAPLVWVNEFSNQTQNAQWESFGLMLRDWIEQSLLETGKIVLHQDNEQASTGPSKNIQNKYSDVLIIQGKYYMTGTDRMTLTAEVVDAKSNQVKYSMPAVSSSVNDFQFHLNEVKQQLLGYILASQVQTGSGQRPPRYDAYLSYRKGLETPSDQIYQKEYHLKEAIAKDTAFIQPYFTLVELAGTWGHQYLQDSILSLLDRRYELLTDYQYLQLESFKARWSGNLLKSASIQWKLYQQYHIENGATKAIYFYVSSNQAKMALQIYHQFKPKERNPGSGNPKDQAYLGDVVEAYAALQQHDSIIHFIQQLQYPVLHYTLALAHLEALTKKREWSILDSMLIVYQNQLPIDQRLYTPPILAWKVVSTLYLDRQFTKLDDYVHKLEQVNDAHPNNMFFQYFKSIVFYLRGAYLQAAEAYQLHYHNTPQFRFFIAFPSVCFIKAGQASKAAKWMQSIQNEAKGYPGQIEYALGVYEANNSHFDQAVNHFKNAFSKGFEFDFYSYQNDLLLLELMDYPAFKQWIAPEN